MIAKYGPSFIMMLLAVFGMSASVFIGVGKAQSELIAVQEQLTIATKDRIHMTTAVSMHGSIVSDTDQKFALRDAKDEQLEENINEIKEQLKLNAKHSREESQYVRDALGQILKALPRQ